MRLLILCWGVTYTPLWNQRPHRGCPITWNWPRLNTKNFDAVKVSLLEMVPKLVTDCLIFHALLMKSKWWFLSSMKIVSIVKFTICIDHLKGFCGTLKNMRGVNIVFHDLIFVWLKMKRV
ncbi:hypothetical protein H5410_052833 [Solanum commersonii]|uniref:Uncharacterized protein n=1 Tax=Solanum commersonii TaxID=4109 RepID=A0A9J5X4R1_SOLCO|nr:hypothetical protein H5410_052833 [Solanum commersonii]